MGTNAQVALERFARYFEAEDRILPVSEKSRYRLDPDSSTRTSMRTPLVCLSFLDQPTQDTTSLLRRFRKFRSSMRRKPSMTSLSTWTVPRGASITPFTHAKASRTKWYVVPFTLDLTPCSKQLHEFSTPMRQVSQYIGPPRWSCLRRRTLIIWRDESDLPKHLIFKLHYPGCTEDSYTLNFSRAGSQIIA